jgi:FKBP-type peptidyl-prolyl cis-trans isomerase
MTRWPSGLELLAETEGSGTLAERGDRVTYNVRIRLNRGDEIPINETQAQQGLPAAMLRHEDGRVLIDHTVVLGGRRAIAGIERALVGMRPGGHRQVRIGPHLAYRERGLPGLIPPHAVLIVDIWMREVTTGPHRPSGTDPGAARPERQHAR